MNLDEWMTVWKSQDAAPVHDVKENLLQQALRQEQAKLQKARRKERLVTYASSAFIAALLVLLFAMMVSFRNRPDKVMTLWDYVLPIMGMASALIAAGSIYVDHRAQARREQRFGDSLRDRIKRRIAQLDDVVTGIRRRNVIFVLMGAICPVALLHLGMRVNDKSLRDVRLLVVFLLVWCFVLGARSIHRAVQQAAARKRDLEALLKELDGQ